MPIFPSNYIENTTIKFRFILILFFFLALFFISNLDIKISPRKVFVQISSCSGGASFSNMGTWGPIKPGMSFESEVIITTASGGQVSINLPWDNGLKIFPSSEIRITIPTVASSAKGIVKAKAQLLNGEVTVSIGVAGREKVEIEAGDVIVVGFSGLFKVIFDSTTMAGEVVVKNGLVECIDRIRSGRRQKISGFYKTLFSPRKIESPKAANILSYVWR